MNEPEKEFFPDIKFQPQDLNTVLGLPAPGITLSSTMQLIVSGLSPADFLKQVRRAASSYVEVLDEIIEHKEMKVNLPARLDRALSMAVAESLFYGYAIASSARNLQGSITEDFLEIVKDRRRV
jgi:hypothetical protein